LLILTIIFSACPSGSYINPLNECVSCPANSTSQALSTSIYNCTCNYGFGFNESSQTCDGIQNII